MKKKHKNLFVIIFCLAGLLETVACGKKTQTNTASTKELAGVNSPLPTVDFEKKNNLTSAQSPSSVLTPTSTPALTQSPIPSPSLILTPSSTPASDPSSVPTPAAAPALSSSPTLIPATTSPLDPKISYRGIAVDGGIVTVYISEDPARQQVVLRKRGGEFHSFEWDYNLDYGDPVIYTESCPKNFEKFDFSEGEEILAIWLPTKPLTEKVFQFSQEQNEICGEGHYFSLDALSDADSGTLCDVRIDAFAYADSLGKLTTGYAKNDEGREIFSLFSAAGQILEQYPQLCLQEDYPLVYGSLHIAEGGNIGQKFGIRLKEDAVLWLGQYDNEKLRLFLDTAIFDECFTPFIQSWWPHALGIENSEMLLDLDGDGAAEKIVWYVEGERNNKRLRLFINGAECEVPSVEWGECSPLLTLTLDGRTNQLAVIDYAYGNMNRFLVFGYHGGEIYKVGAFSDMVCEKKEIKGKNIYISHAVCHPLQTETVWVEQELVDGKLRIIPQDYYEFVQYNPEQENSALLAKENIELYQEKNKGATWLLTKGSYVVPVGTDLENWILLEKQDTKERGWLYVPMREGSGNTCILPDGTQAEGNEIFEGLWNAG